MRLLFPSLLLLLTVTGCARIELASHFIKKGIGGGSQSEGQYKVGSPYTIRGKRYYPKEDFDYNKTGVASWYGPGFHGKSTANGERYDQNALTAAHKTLPMPSIVRVTNLENGRSIIVRVNDRGPFAHGRIIDMSKRGAELLGFKRQGIAKVRVEILEEESKHVGALAKRGESTRGIEVAMNKKNYRLPDSGHTAQVQQVAYRSQPPAQSAEPVQRIELASSTVPAGQSSLFVQTGAFSTREAAMKYASALDSFGRAQIYPAVVDGQQLYRVRFPAQDVASADALLERLYSGGYKSAIIVVD